MITAGKVRDSLASTLERLVAFHGERPWSYSDVQTAANVLTLAVDAALGGEDDGLPVAAKEGAAPGRGGSSAETPVAVRPAPGQTGTASTPDGGSPAAASPAARVAGEPLVEAGAL